jgi:hypothetical protein
MGRGWAGAYLQQLRHARHSQRGGGVGDWRWGLSTSGTGSSVASRLCGAVRGQVGVVGLRRRRRDETRCCRMMSPVAAAGWSVAPVRVAARAGSHCGWARQVLPGPAEAPLPRGGSQSTWQTQPDERADGTAGATPLAGPSTCRCVWSWRVYGARV